MVGGIGALFEPSPTRMAASSLTPLTSWGRGILIKLQACWQKLLLAEAPARPQKHLHHEMCARSAQSLGGVEGARCAWLPSRGGLGSLCD